MCVKSLMVVFDLCEIVHHPGLVWAPRANFFKLLPFLRESTIPQPISLREILVEQTPNRDVTFLELCGDSRQRRTQASCGGALQLEPDSAAMSLWCEWCSSLFTLCRCAYRLTAPALPLPGGTLTRPDRG